MADDQNPQQQQVEFQSPTTGARQVVPPEHWDEALKSGYRPTTHVVMYSSSGERGMVPKELAGQYRDQGYSITAPGSETQFEKDRQPGAPGTGFLSGVVSAVKSMVPTSAGQLLDMAKPPSQSGAEAGLEGARRLLRPNQPQGPGFGATYKVAETLSPLVPGLNPESMEKRADVGDTAGIVGEAAVPTAAAIAPSIIKGGRKLLTTPPAERAANLYERTVAPGGTKAEGQLESRQTFKQAAPYLAQQERQTPVINKQIEGQFKGQDLGVMNYRQNAQAAAHNLWSQIEPRARMYETTLLEPTKAGVTAPQAVRSTVNPTEAQLNPAKVAGVQGLADFTGKIGTVGEALQRIQELNADKGVQAYEKALPDKQAELLKGDPTIEGKITAANTLRDQVFDSIEKHGNPDDANWIRKARSDYGALTEVAKNLGNAQVPTPAPLLTRLANSTRMALSPTFAREYLSKPVSTLFDLNNPNRLAEKSSGLLGRSDLFPAPPPPVRPTVYNPAMRPPGPIVGPRPGAPPPFTGGGGAPMITPPQTPVAPGPGVVNTANVTPESPMWTPAEQNPPFQMKPGGMWSPPTMPPVVQSEGAPPPVPTSTPPATTAASPAGGPSVPPTMPPPPEGAVLDRGTVPWDEEVKRRGPGELPMEPTPQSPKEAKNVEAAKRREATNRAALNKKEPQ